MPVHTTVVGVLHSYEPDKENPEKGMLSLAVREVSKEQQSGDGSAELTRKDYRYRRISSDSLKLHVGVWTSFNSIDGEITSYLLR